MKLLSKTKNGQIAYCRGRDKYFLEFGNIYIHVSKQELIELYDFIRKLDCMYYLNLNKDAHNRRKILLNIGSKKIFFSLYMHEFIELQELLFIDTEFNVTDPPKQPKYNYVLN